MRVNILGAVERRRRWSQDEKARIIEETLAPGAKVSAVARHYGMSQSLLFAWRREARTINSVGKQPRIVPVLIADPGINAAVPASCEHSKQMQTPAAVSRTSMIEIDLGRGRRIRVDAQFDADALVRVIDVLESR